MRKLKKLAIWALVLSMVLSLFAGLSLTAHAEGALSATYPEATELLTNIGFMDNKEKAWTDYITASEASAVLKKVYDSAGFAAPWEDIPEADTISGADFTVYAMKTVGWGDIWATYFNLAKGITGYNPANALTREQAAQLVRNLFTVSTTYSSAMTAKRYEAALNLGIGVSYDAFGRPSVQWYKDGVPVTGVYADTPVAVVNGGVPTNYVLDMVGATATFAGASYHAYMKISDNGAAFPDNYTLYYQDGFAEFMSFGYTIEIYDTYEYLDFNGHGNKTYTVTATNQNYLAEVTTFNDTKFLGLYGQDNGTTYGWWSAAVASCPAINSAEDGFYIAYFNNGAVGGLYKATKIVGTLDAYDPASSIITISGTPRMFTPLFKYGRYFLLDINEFAAYNSNKDKTFSFYLDRMGNVVGMGCTECAFGKPTDQNGVEGTHSSECPNCHRIATADHTYPETWTLSEGNATHEHVCTACGGGAVKEGHNLDKNWTYLNQSYHYRDCDDCDYSEVEKHDTELRNYVAATILAQGYSGDLYCKVCEELVEAGHVTDKVTHNHEAGEPKKEDEILAGCEQDGSYNSVVRCIHCGEIMSSTSQTLPARGHAWTETGRMDATDLENGLITYVCENDESHKKTEVIPAGLTGVTDYPEAAEVMTASGVMVADNQVWKQTLTPAEAIRALNVLYAAPGFAAPWTPTLSTSDPVTATALVKDLITPLGYGAWGVSTTEEWMAYHHLLKGLPADFSCSAALTREQAAQILLNALKAIPEYNQATIKANDPGLGLSLVRVGETEDKAPTYKWQKGGVDVSATYADTPVAVIKGGADWESILNTVGDLSWFSGAGIHAFFRTSLDGEAYSDYVLHFHGEGAGAFLNNEWTVTIYDNYGLHSGLYSGIAFNAQRYDLVCVSCKHTGMSAWTPAEGGENHERSCPDCGRKETEKHTLSDWTYQNAEKHVRSCEACGYSETAAHETELRNYVASTILAQGYSGDLYCKTCGELLEAGHVTDVVSHNHEEGEPKREDEILAGCEQDGSYNSVVRCIHCGEIMSSVSQTIPAHGHDWEETGRTDATETEDGEIRYVCRHDAQHTKTEVILSKQNAKIDYPEAVELMKASGLMDATNNAWKQKLTGAEANTLLQALYDGPGFINPWSPGLNVEGTVTGADFIHKAIYTLGYSYWEDQLWIDFFHLTRGLAAYDAGAELTREEAAQITLNVLKAAPQYNTAGIKANDGNIGLQLVKADEDELHRPSYKWQKNSADITAVYKDTPIVTLEGGKSWDDVLDALGLTDTFAQVMEHGFFRFSENGDGFSDYVLEYHGTPDPVWKTSDWTLEFYDNYYKHTAIFPGNGVEFTCKAYDVIGIGESGQGGQEELPEVNWNTSYPEAAELVTKTRLMDADKSWKENLSADEANRVLQALYDAPHFAAEWHPGFTSDDQVTGSAFISKALVTIGWNYSNDEIFSVYNHLKKGLLSGYISSKLLTREQAAQIVLNVLKSIPTYNPDVLKANDPELNLRLVKTGVDAYNRPTYKWQRNGLDITGSYADQPLATMKGGVSWTEILNAVGDIGAVNFPASFRWSENGGEFSAYEDHVHPDYNLFKTADWNLEIYADYSPAHQGLGYEIVCYGGEPLKVNDTEWYGEGDAVMRCPIPLSEFVGVTMDGRLLDPENYTATEGSTIITIKEEYLNTLEPGSHSVCLVFRTGAAYATLAVKGEVVDTGTSYPEAVELMTNCGFMDGADKDWKKYLTGAEANKLLNMLYDGPGFVADWDPGYAEDLDRISAGSFISKALVTIGWNYNNDILFCYYNHLTKGILPEDYAWDKALTREVAAQIVLNTLKTIPTYNQSSLKANDPGIALSLVQTGEDNYHRPYYKWVRYGEDMTSSYPDTPILASQGGLRWTDILISVGDCGAINLPASFRWSETGGAFSKYVDKVHPDFTVFKNPNWAVEIYLDYSTEHAGYGYNIVTYVGTVDPIHPATGDNAISIWIPIAAMAASAAAAAYILISRKKRKENA